MKLPIDGIQAFVQIAESGNFNKAAEKLFITQTALTRRIQRLEAFVGEKLLDRTTRSTTLAPLGREFLPLATRLVADMTSGLERLRSASKLALGDATVATLQSVASQQLPLALRQYARKYPHNRVTVLERSGSLVTEAVRLGHADFGIHIEQGPVADLAEERVLRSPFVLVCGRTHRLAQSRQVAWKDLHDVDLITLGGSSGNRRVVEAQLARQGLALHGRFVVESTPTALALARAHVGAALLPAAVQQTSALTGLVEVALVEPVIYRSISLVRRRNESLAPAGAALYETVKAQFAAAESTGRRGSPEE